MKNTKIKITDNCWYSVQVWRNVDLFCTAFFAAILQCQDVTAKGGGWRWKSRDGCCLCV